MSLFGLLARSGLRVTSIHHENEHISTLVVTAGHISFTVSIFMIFDRKVEGSGLFYEQGPVVDKFPPNQNGTMDKDGKIY